MSSVFPVPCCLLHASSLQALPYRKVSSEPRLTMSLNSQLNRVWSVRVRVIRIRVRAAGTHLRIMPPSREAFRHSGGASLRRTSATLTLYFEFEASRERRPGTLQKRSEGCRPLGSRASLSSHSDLTPAGTQGASQARPHAGSQGGVLAEVVVGVDEVGE